MSLLSVVRGHIVYFTAWDEQDIGEQESGFSGALMCVCMCVCPCICVSVYCLCVCVLVCLCACPCVLIFASLS